VPDAGRCIIVRDDRKDIDHVVIVGMTTRDFPCVYVVLLVAGNLNRSPAYPIQDDYAFTNAVLHEIKLLLQAARVIGSTAGHL
jgi:hypothetical protein